MPNVLFLSGSYSLSFGKGLQPLLWAGPPAEGVKIHANRLKCCVFFFVVHA